MLTTFITITIIVVAIVLWITSTQRRLLVLDEHISNAMSQIGVQLSSRFDALISLLELTKSYAKDESEMLMEVMKSRRSGITKKSTPIDVIGQEGVMLEILEKISVVIEEYPNLKSTPNYIKTMDAVKTFDNMVRTSRLIYNDSVTRLNREIRLFPVSMIAGMLGFEQKEYLVEQEKRKTM